MTQRPYLVIVSAALLAVGLVILAVRTSGPGPVAADARPVVAEPTATTAPRAAEPEPTSPAASPTTSPTPEDRGMVGASTVGSPWGTIAGLLQFRGNPTRTWYGTGPVPTAPREVWRYPDRTMCTEEVTGEEVVQTTDAEGNVVESTRPVTKLWCGTGWTGQPVVWERPDGVTEVIFGGFDGAVHFVDAATGEPTRAKFQTGHMIKGSVTLDPNGFPLLYFGSRDDNLRIVALDRGDPVELWRLPANPNRVWNNDWDGNPVIVDGLLLEGGEDSWFYAVELNRDTDADGLVTVAPEVLVEVQGWNDQLFRDVGDRNVSIENSVAVFEDRVYFANSGGRVVGLDLADVRRGEAPVVFDYWVGDDVDASIVVDAEGMLYVSVELERFLPRAEEVGQLVKLDPYTAGDPRVWGVAVPPRSPSGGPDDGGIWGTPALHEGLLYATTHPGDLLVVDTATGEVVWQQDIGYHEWSSPVVVEGTLIVGACEEGGLLAWSLRDPRAPTPRWDVTVGGGACIESTPAVWNGGIYVGSRDGFFYGLR